MQVLTRLGTERRQTSVRIFSGVMTRIQRSVFQVVGRSWVTRPDWIEKKQTDAISGLSVSWLS